MPGEDQKNEDGPVIPANETKPQREAREKAEAKAAQEQAEADRQEAEAQRLADAEAAEADRDATNGARFFKASGSADIKEIPRGDTAGNTLPPLPVTITFEKTNGWVVSSDQFADVPPVWWDHLSNNEPGIDEVTDYVRDGQAIPLNAHQRHFLGMVQAGEPSRRSEPASLADSPVSSR